MNRTALLSTFGATAVIALVYAVILMPGEPPAWASGLMVLGVATQMVGVAALGASRGGRIGRVAMPLLLAWLILVLGFGLALALPAETAAAPQLVMGLPRRTALILYGVGLLPLLAMPLAYALTFDDTTLSDEHLQQLRAAAERIGQ